MPTPSSFSGCGEARLEIAPDVFGERRELLLKSGMDMDKQPAGAWPDIVVADQRGDVDVRMAAHFRPPSAAAGIERCAQADRFIELAGGHQRFKDQLPGAVRSRITVRQDAGSLIFEPCPGDAAVAVRREPAHRLGGECKFRRQHGSAQIGFAGKQVRGIQAATMNGMSRRKAVQRYT